MTDMLRGRRYGCGCCQSKPYKDESARAISNREAATQIREEVDDMDEISR